MPSEVSNIGSPPQSSLEFCSYRKWCQRFPTLRSSYVSVCSGCSYYTWVLLPTNWIQCLARDQNLPLSHFPWRGGAWLQGYSFPFIVVNLSVFTVFRWVRVSLPTLVVLSHPLSGCCPLHERKSWSWWGLSLRSPNRSSLFNFLR